MLPPNRVRNKLNVSRAVWHVTASCWNHILSSISRHKKVLIIVRYRSPSTVTACSSSFLKKIRTNDTPRQKKASNCHTLIMHWHFVNLPRIFIASDATILFIYVTVQMEISLVTENDFIAKIIVLCLPL